MPKYLDKDYLYSLLTKEDKKNVKVSLRRGKKGLSLFCKKPIKKGQVIAYYTMKLYKRDSHRGVKGGMYLFLIETKSGRDSRIFVGDLFSGSALPPKKGIPYWAYFSNEPSYGEEENSYVDTWASHNYKDRKRAKEGGYLHIPFDSVKKY